MVEAALREINVETEVIGLEWETYLSRITNGEHDMYIHGWATVTGDADYGLYPLFHSSSYGESGNPAFWSSPESDELLERGRSISDESERLQIYRELQTLIHAEAPWVLISQGEFLIATAANVNGFEIAPMGHHSFYRVYGS
jgi:peptide/nickel transport system substrate-binding protein